MIYFINQVSKDPRMSSWTLHPFQLQHIADTPSTTLPHDLQCCFYPILDGFRVRNAADDLCEGITVRGVCLNVVNKQEVNSISVCLQSSVDDSLSNGNLLTHYNNISESNYMSLTITVNVPHLQITANMPVLIYNVFQ